MTIAYVSDAIYPYNKGGKEVRLYEISTRLAAMGHDVHVYTMKWWDGPNDKVENGVNLHAISKYYPMYAGDRRSIKEALSFGLACYKMLLKKFDIVDVDHMPFFPIYSMWIVCLLKRKKLFGTWHEALSFSDWKDYMGTIPGTVAYIIERLSIKLPYKVTVSSAHTQELILSELKRSKRVYLVPPGVDVKQMRKYQKTKIKIDVLFVGRLVKDKNVQLLIKSIKKLVDKKQDIQCFIIGSGIEESNLRKQINTSKLEDYVHILPPLESHEDIYRYMTTAKVFTLPSKREGFGMVALEALACNTPVITTNLASNGAKSLIADNSFGSVIKPTVDELASAIHKWIRQRPDLKFINDLVKEYDWSKLADSQHEVYSE